MLETTIDLEDPDNDLGPCETCGYSYDELRLHINYDTIPGESLFSVSTSVGCYGGESCDTDDVWDVWRFLRDVAKRFPHAADDINALASFLRDVFDATPTRSIKRPDGSILVVERFGK